jgi:membrane protease YdiL (CAAX protease family)
MSTVPLEQYQRGAAPPRARQQAPPQYELREFRDPPPGFGRYPWWTPIVALVAGLALMAPLLLLIDHLDPPFRASLGEGTFVGVLFAVAYLLMARTRARPSLADLGFRATPSRAAVGWVVVARLTYGMVSAIYISAVKHVTPNAPLGPVNGASTLKAVDVIIAAVLLAPLGEELFFRGYMYASLRGRMPVFWAALISAGLFGATHPVFGSTAWNLVPVLAIAGFAMCLLYERTGSLWAPIAFHMMMNVGVVYVVTGSTAAPLIAVGATMLLFLLAPWRWGARRRAARTQQPSAPPPPAAPTPA